jgi:hypothetical protein
MVEFGYQSGKTSQNQRKVMFRVDRSLPKEDQKDLVSI